MSIRHRRSAKRERGAALLAAVLLLVLGVATAGLTFFRPTPAATVIEDRTGDALAQVKQALVGYASAFCSNPDPQFPECPTRPGELPCPDITNDGLADAPCASNRIGRVPWKTLRIPEPKDHAGETLWYAVASTFLSSAAIINSHTTGNLRVFTVHEKEPAQATQVAEIAVPPSVTPAPPTAEQATRAAVAKGAAVIFSPGSAINGQNRGSSKATCGATPNVPRNLCPANYLESVVVDNIVYNNAAMAGPFISSRPATRFNDRLIYLTAADLIPPAEMRVGAALTKLLLDYRQGAKCRCFPWADSWEYSGGIADIGVNRGRFPAFQVKPVAWGTNNADNKIPPLPAWITQNDWHNVVFYSVSRQHSDQAGKNCYFCSANPMLTVLANDQPGSTSETASALLFTPGLPRNGRLANASPSDLLANDSAANNMHGYLDDPLNYNKYAPKAKPPTSCPGWNAEHASGSPSSIPANVEGWCDTYVRPSARTPDRDRLYIVSHCSADAALLLQNAPCKDNADPEKVSPICAALVASLQTCSMCKQAAIDLTTVPCLNTLNSSNCDAPIAKLKLCSR